MCLIVDANLASIVFGPASPDFRPIIDWLTLPKKDGKLVIGGRLKGELYKIEAARRFIASLLDAGRAKIIPDDVTDKETLRVAPLCKSNDPHVIALAKISGAKFYARLMQHCILILRI
jgi:hypothetical protein